MNDYCHISTPAAPRWWLPAALLAAIVWGSLSFRMGAEVAIFASFIRDDESCRSYRLLLACDPAWFKEYERQGRFDDDPWLAYAQRHSVPVRSVPARPLVCPAALRSDWRERSSRYPNLPEFRQSAEPAG